MNDKMGKMDTPGAHILVWYVVLLTGAAFCVFHVPKGEDLIAAAVVGIGIAMKGLNGQRVSTSTTPTSSTSTETIVTETKTPEAK